MHVKRFVVAVAAVGIVSGGAIAQEAPAEAASGKPQTEALNPIDRIPVSDTIKIPTLDFKNTDVRDVLRAIGMQYGVNIYLEENAKGSVSLYLADIPVRQAIDFIVKKAQLAYTVENEIVKVFKYEAPPAPPPPKPPVVFKFEGGKLSLDVKNLPADEVAKLFIDSANINVVVEGSAKKEISARLRGIEPDKALKVVFEPNGYDVNVVDGVYYVAVKTWGDQAEKGQPQTKRLSISLTKDNKVSLEVDNAALDQVVRTIAIQSGINIFIYDKITGSISAKCDSVFIDDALRFLLQNTTFTFWKDKRIYFVGSREMSQQKTTLVIPLKHIMAAEEDITKILPPGITKEAVIKFDNEHNAVIVIGSFDVVASAQEFLEKIDSPVPQVLIEALVVDFNMGKIREFGISVFTGSATDTSFNWHSEEFIPQIDVKPGRKRTERVLNEVLSFLGANRVVQLPENFRSSIQALEAADVVKVHSTPQIATINGNPASITIGETRYYKLAKETRAVTTQSENLVGTDERFEVLKFNTQLDVTPWVMDEGFVMVKIRPEFNIPRTGGDGSTPPNVDTRVLESMVRLRNGQTIVLGGQRQTEDVVNRKGVPFLSSIPVLGLLFSSTKVQKVETQMMIFLTPHVYYGDEASVAPDQYFGNEINRMLDKYDPEKRKESRRQRRELRQKKAETQREFPWPWKIVKERRQKRADEDETRQQDK